MKTWKKILIGVVALLVVLVVALVVAVNILVTPERVRETVVPLVEESLQRDLQLGEIEISLFSGITLNDLVLAERDGEKPFVAVDKAVLRYSLWSLLLLKVEITELRLERPQVVVIKFKDGTFNFSDMAKTGEAPEAAAPAPEPAASGSASGPPLAIHVSQIVIANGSLDYRDLAAGDAGRHSLSELNLTVREFSTREPFSLDFSGDWNGNKLALAGRFDLDDKSFDASCGFNRIELTFKGDLLADAKGERLRARVTLPSLALQDMIGSLPQGTVDQKTLPKLGGSLALEAEFDGLLDQPKQLLQSARIGFEKTTVESGELVTELDGSLQLEKMALATKQLQLKLNGETLLVTAKVADLLQQPVVASLDITGKRFDLDRLLPPAAAEEKQQKPVAAAKSEKAAAEIGPFDIPLTLTGNARIDELLYRKLALKDATLRFALKQNRLSLERLSAGIGEGEFVQSGAVDLGVKGLRYNGQTTLTQLPANPIVKALQPKLGESVYGTVDGSITLSGAGTVPETLKKNLSGDGRLGLKQAKLTRMPALDSAAGLLGVDDLKEIDINDGAMTFKVRNGVVKLNLKTNGSKLRQTTQGDVTLNGQLKLKTDLVLSPVLGKKISRRGALGKVLTDKEGWTHVPLLISGDYAAPKVSPDVEAITKQATEGAVEQLKQKLQKKLGGQKQDGAAQDDPASKLIDGALKGLLGN